MDHWRCSHIFREIAALLALHGDDPFRIRAYRRAAQALAGLRESLSSLARRGALEEIPGIGKTLAREIQEFLDTGSLRYHERLKATVPESLLPLLHLPSLTPAQVRILWRQHGIASMKQLAQAHRDAKLPLEATTLAALEKDLEAWEREQQRMLLGVALPRAEVLVQNLARLAGVERVALAGSLRRGAARVGDLNVVIATADPSALLRHCQQQPEVRRVLASGPATATLLTSEGLRLTLAAVPPAQFALALLQHTGSAAHLAQLQQLAHRRGWRLQAEGLQRLADGSTIEVASEEALYALLGLPFIAPELREGRGEIEAALSGTLPRLLTAADVQGDLHVHSEWGHGAHSLEDIARAGQRLGYRYVAICDYAYSPATGRGLSPRELAQQLEAIRRLNATLAPAFCLLAGAEVEISAAGDLDFDTALLQELDLVVAAAHTGLKASRRDLTRRLCKALEHPLVHVLAHPTGRLLGRPELPNLDVQAVLETAAATGTALEINGHLLRLDLPDVYVQQARDLGVTFALGSDAHSVQEMRALRYGVLTARRGWVEAAQLLNALPAAALLSRLRARKPHHVA
ncbi:MAG: DNA polymerase/3'-5' exonuclease PolX [Candidatus Tectimicrobiota bacterium]|nr:MAG: DNA polymerase/3'-5' exonuclease PolX [Candidatus Tectomicrobia bacterium]